MEHEKFQQYLTHAFGFDMRCVLVLSVALSLSALDAPSFVGGEAFAQSSSKAKKKSRSSNRGRSKAKSSRKKPSAAKQFAKGKKLFDQAKYNEALQVFSDLLRHYPAHSASQLMMAKSFYRLERQSEAYALFARQNPQYLDAESSYEYGMTMFKAKQFPQALYAFRNIKKKHSLYDLANYYGGLSAVKLRKFKLAEELMEKAVVLPDKLAKSRTEYLKHLAELRTLREKQELAKQRKAEKERMRKKKDPKAKKAEEAKPEAPKEYAHSGLMGISKGAKVGLTNKSQRYDLHGFGIKDSNVRVGSFGFSQGPMWTFGKSMKRRTATGIQLSVSGADVDITGEEQRNFVFDNSQDILRIQRTASESHTKQGDFSVAPWVEFPVPNDLWVGFGTSVAFTYYDFERSKREGVRNVFLQVGGPLGGTSSLAKVSFTDLINSDNEPQTNIVTFSASSSFTKFTDVGLSLSGKVKNYDYLDNPLDGPDTTIGLVFSASKPFMEVVSGSLTTSFENQTNHIAHGLGSFSQINSDVQIFGGKVGLSASVGSYLSLSASYEIQQYKWDVIDDNQRAERQETLERNKQDILETTEIGASLSLNF